MRFRLEYLFVILGFCYVQAVCAADGVSDPPAKKRPAASVKGGKEGPAVIDADKLTGKANDQIQASGDATIKQDGKSIRADSLIFNQRTHQIDAQGGVVLKQDGNTMNGPHLIYNLDGGDGVMDKPEFYLEENMSRGSAEKLHILDRYHFSMDDATYTTCPAGNRDWEMGIGLLEIDREREVGVAHNALVEFKGVPILYTPWMDFPLNNQRKSGFLAPIFGGTVKGGSEITLPFYLNIAPNFDATLAPRLMTKRGLMLNNEFRYMEPNYTGELHVDVLPNDAIANRRRARFSLKHDQILTQKLRGYLNVTRVGDNDYFRDLGDAVNTTSQANLLQEGGVNYNGGWWSAMARVQHYQTLQDPVSPIVIPYTRLPQLTLNARDKYAGADLNFDGEFVNFSHPTAVNASRVVLNPSVSYPLIKAPAFYMTPKLSLHSAYYAMGANNTGTLNNFSSTLPMFSLDSGISLEREGNLFNNGYVQTLEPRAFYVYIPYKDQSQLPNFDSAQADFGLAQMFMENRFYGNDRVGDANYLTLALTSRVLDQDGGMEHLKMLIGQRISFSSPRVNLVTPASTSNKSDVLVGLSGRVNRQWSLDSELQFDPNQSHAQLYNIAANYSPEVGKTLNLGYRFSRNTLRQVDISTQWPLFGRWHAVARWNYSIQDSKILEAIGGLEYNQDCWMLRLVAQRFATAALQSNTGFFLQLELNDFVKVGSDPLDLLKQSVPGYTKLNDNGAPQPLQTVPY